MHQGTAVEVLEEKLKSLQAQREEFFGLGGGSQAQDPPLGVIPELDNSLITGAAAVAEKTGETADNIAAFVDPLERFNNLYDSTIEKLEAREAALQRQRDAQEAYNKLVEDLRTDEERLTDQVRERLAVLDAVQDITDAQRNQTLGRIADDATEEAPELGGVSSMEGIDTARTELQDWYGEQLDMLRKFREERADLKTTWDEEELALQEEYENRLTEITKANEEIRTQQMLDGYSAILDVAGKYYEGLEGEEAAYTRAAIQLGQTLLDEKKRNALESILTSTHSAAMGAYEALASIPYVGPALGATAAGTVYAAGAVAAAGVTGMAHDGIDAVPEDGTWLLQQGERVTTAETSAKLDRTLDDVQRGMSGRNGPGGMTVNNNFNMKEQPTPRTRQQLAAEAAQRQRMVERRLGSRR
ncbi:hypothetical protein [Microbulbifer halophilus]|uniref:hypothetical protein n=1 Tax=Microbulbifer halophilus TaxID=453963 RepID=UPI00360607B9